MKKTSKSTSPNLLLTVVLAFIFGVGGGFVGTNLPTQKNGEPTEKITERTVTKTIVVEESDMTSTVEKLSPSVVSIVISKDLEHYYASPFPFEDEIFREFFGQGFNFKLPEDNGSRGGKKQQIGGGSGFIITEDGLVLTNKHVVSDNEAQYTIVLNDGTEYKGEVISRDVYSDIAVVQMRDADGNKPEGLPVAELGSSRETKIGQRVLAIGNARSRYENTVTAGIISAKGRAITAADSGNGGATQFEGLLQTDAAINPGNSGGPLANLDGQVIGVNVAIDLSARGVGFAIPIDDVKPVIDSIKEHGKIVRPRLGVRYRLLTETVAKELQLKVENGALLVGEPEEGKFAVIPGGPADKAGIEMGDVILEVNGKEVSIENTLQHLVKMHQPGDVLKLKVWQKGQVNEIEVILDEALD